MSVLVAKRKSGNLDNVSKTLQEFSISADSSSDPQFPGNGLSLR